MFLRRMGWPPRWPRARIWPGVAGVRQRATGNGRKRAGKGAARKGVAMARCEAEFHAARPVGMVFLTCDLDTAGHAGLNHHDPGCGIWWSACTLEDHGHAGTPGERVEQRRAWRASLRGSGEG